VAGSPRQSSGTGPATQLAAFTVTENADGSVTFTARDLVDPAAATRALNRVGSITIRSTMYPPSGGVLLVVLRDQDVGTQTPVTVVHALVHRQLASVPTCAGPQH